MLFNVGELIVSNYILHMSNLHTKLFCMQLTKAYMAETPCNQLPIDTAK